MYKIYQHFLITFNNIEKYGHEIEVNEGSITKEILHVNLDFNIYEPKQFINEINTIKSIIDSQLESLNIDTRILTLSERSFHEKLKWDFIYNVHKAVVEENQTLFSRKFIFSSNECISNLHLLYRNNVLFVYVYIRSSDLLKKLPSDILAIMECVMDFMIWPVTTHIKNIKLRIFIGSAHIYMNEYKVLNKIQHELKTNIKKLSNMNDKIKNK